jgi:hypothetical protein
MRQRKVKIVPAKLPKKNDFRLDCCLFTSSQVALNDTIMIFAIAPLGGLMLVVTVVNASKGWSEGGK